MHKYELIIYWSNDDSAFIVEVPELPGCVAPGSSPTARRDQSPGRRPPSREGWWQDSPGPPDGPEPDDVFRAAKETRCELHQLRSAVQVGAGHAIRCVHESLNHDLTACTPETVCPVRSARHPCDVLPDAANHSHHRKCKVHRCGLLLLRVPRPRPV